MNRDAKSPRRSSTPKVIKEQKGLWFFVPYEPPKTTHHHKKIVRIWTKEGPRSKLADKPELEAARGSYFVWFAKHRPAEPITGPISVTIEATWPWQSGTSAKVKALGRIPCAVKPDCDDFAKTVTDCLATLRFMETDSRIVELIVRKWHGDEVGLLVRIMPVMGGF